MTTSSYNIFLAFREAEKPRGCKARCISKIFDWWDGVYEGIRFKHVEIILEYEKGNQVCYGSTSRYNGVHSEVNRRFTSHHYTKFRQCILPEADFEECRLFCEREEGHPFKSYDYDFAQRQVMRCCMSPKPKHSYACSDFVCQALQKARVIPLDWIPEITTTQTLWNYVESDSRWSVPNSTELDFLTNG